MLALKEKEVRNEISLLILKSKEKGITDEEAIKLLDNALQKEIDLNKEVTQLKQTNLELGLKEIKQANDRAFANIDLSKSQQ